MAHFRRWLGVAAALGGWLFLAAPELEAAGPERLAVSSESAAATREALAVLEAGGNAVDAAVTAALVGGVASPSSSGLGGGGFALVWLAADRQAKVLDFREVAPAKIDTAAFEGSLDARRGQLVGVPGEPAGLYELHRRFGKKPWAELAGQAARLAARGFVVGQHLASAIKDQRDPALRSLLFPAGKALVPGQKVRRPALAKTLRRLASEGPKAFYSGPIAAEIARVARAHGGALEESDFAAYAPKEREPLRVGWEGLTVYTMPPPSAGGLMLAQVLALNSRAELRSLGLASPAYVHVVAEAMRGALVDRARYVGDPDIVKVDVPALLGEERLAERKRRIALDRTHTVASIASREQGTHHLVTYDAEGNVVSLTTTINTGFGIDVMAPASGVILNDELDDFSADHEVAPYTSHNPNRARPFARPTSSMTPTLVVDRGQVVLAIGGSGGPTIPGNVTQVLLSRLVFGTGIREAIEAPRFVVGTGSPTLRLEPGFGEREKRELAWRGEQVADLTWRGFAVQAVAVGETIEAAADSRKHGEAATGR